MIFSIFDNYMIISFIIIKLNNDFLSRLISVSSNFPFLLRADCSFQRPFCLLNNIKQRRRGFIFPLKKQEDSSVLAKKAAMADKNKFSVLFKCTISELQQSTVKPRPKIRERKIDKAVP